MVKKYFLLLIACSLVSNIVHSAETETIIWAVGHSPPRLVLDGPGNLSGQGGIQQDILQTGLSTYQHIQKILSYKQFEDALKKGSKFCSSFMFKTPSREKFAWFSIPWHIDIPHRIIIRTDAYEKLNKPKEVSLAQFITNMDLHGAIEKSRSYSALDKILKSNKDTNNLELLEVRTARFTAMLNAGLIDYFIEYPHMASYVQKLSNYDLAKISFIPIKESASHYYTRVACPKNEWGKAIIEDINKVITQERSKPSYLSLLKMIHPKKAERELLEKVYYEDFLESE